MRQELKIFMKLAYLLVLNEILICASTDQSREEQLHAIACTVGKTAGESWKCASLGNAALKGKVSGRSCRGTAVAHISNE